MILLEVRVLIIDVQRRDDPLSYDARPASAAGHSRPAHFARKDQLHGFWSAQIDVLPDDLLEKLPPMPRAIPNLSEGKLRLQHRKPITKAGLSVGRWIGVRQRCEPFAEKSLDLLFIETLGEALRRRRVRATQEPVVECFEFDAARGQLPVEILVSVDAELARIGKVGAELDEEGSEVFVHAVKIIVVNHGCGVVDPRDAALAFPEAFADGARHASLLLGDADKDDALGRLELAQALLHNIVFAHPFLKTDDRDAVALGKVEHLVGETPRSWPPLPWSKRTGGPCSRGNRPPLLAHWSTPAHRGSDTSGRCIPTPRRHFHPGVPRRFLAES